MRGLRAAAEFACTACGRRMGVIVIVIVIVIIKARIMQTYLRLPI
jgi:hypothetical protein